MNGRQPQGGGLWNSAKPVISAQTQNLLKSKNKYMTNFFLNLCYELNFAH